MNRTEFMNRLERLLWDIPENERKEALQYYNDYFDDAGPENETRVIKELGSPAQVAKTIREGMSENGEYTERGYEDSRFRDRQNVSADYRNINAEKPSGQPHTGPNLWKLVSILLLCLLLFPLLVPLCLILIAVPVAVLIGIVGIVIAAGIIAVVFPLVGIILTAVAFYNLFVTPAIGITLGGIGLVFLSVGILIFLLTIWIFKTLFPLCIRGAISVIRFPLRKAGIVK